MKLNLGVIDIAYTEGDGITTTGDVAEFLEVKYHVMELFYIEHEDEIADFLVEAMATEIDDISSGKAISDNPFQNAETAIYRLFQTFIETEEIATINPQTPTQAALEGRSKRRKAAKGPRRASFRDTGQYMLAFRAWVEAGNTISSSDLISAITSLGAGT